MEHEDELVVCTGKLGRPASTKLSLSGIAWPLSGRFVGRNDFLEHRPQGFVALTVESSEALEEPFILDFNGF